MAANDPPSGKTIGLAVTNPRDPTYQELVQPIASKRRHIDKTMYMAQGWTSFAKRRHKPLPPNPYLSIFSTAYRIWPRSRNVSTKHFDNYRARKGIMTGTSCYMCELFNLVLRYPLRNAPHIYDIQHQYTNLRFKRVVKCSGRGKVAGRGR